MRDDTATVVFCRLVCAAGASDGNSGGCACGDDAVLEHAALRLWQALRHDKGASDTAAVAAHSALLAVDKMAWNRIPKLLFASNASVARAVAAVMSAAVAPATPACSSSTNAVRSSRSDVSEVIDPPAPIKSAERICERIWSSEWWPRITDKLADCCALCAVSTVSQDVAICEHLLHIVGVVLQSRGSEDPATDAGGRSKCAGGDVRDRANTDDARVCAAIDLVLSLTTSRIARLASCATHVLLSLLRYSGSAAAAAAAALTRDAAASIGHIVQWLATQHAVESSSASGTARTVSHSAVKIETLQLQCAYLELLEALVLWCAAPTTVNASLATTHVQCVPFDVLQLCAPLLSSPQPALQERALRLLHAGVGMNFSTNNSSSGLVAAVMPAIPAQQQQPLHSRSSADMCSAIRVSGLLISLCWLMGHSQRAVAAAAAALLDAVANHSPTPDILRALFEQGCVVVLAVLAASEYSGGGNDGGPGATGGCKADQSPVRGCAELLEWIATAAVHEHVLGVATTSVLRSSNALLQKNVLLSLLLLSQRSAAFKQTLALQQHQDDDDGDDDDSDIESGSGQRFLTDVVQVAIEGNEDGSLATLLLAAAVSWCDRSSALKLEDTGSSFRQSARRSKLGESSCVDASNTDSRVPAEIALAHGCDVVARVDGELLCALSKFARRWIDTAAATTATQCSHESAVLQLEALSEPCAIALFAEVLAKSQHEAAALLKREQVDALLTLLELSQRLECAKSWHFASFALAHALHAGNWFAVFRFAARVRHPSLMLRAVRVALEYFEHAVPHSSSSGSSELVCELKTAAFQMYCELYDA